MERLTFEERNRNSYQKVSDVSQVVIDKYKNLLPQELIVIWETFGFGIYEDGFLQLVNPTFGGICNAVDKYEAICNCRIARQQKKHLRQPSPKFGNSKIIYGVFRQSLAKVKLSTATFAKIRQHQNHLRQPSPKFGKDKIIFGNIRQSLAKEKSSTAIFAKIRQR